MIIERGVVHSSISWGRMLFEEKYHRLIFTELKSQKPFSDFSAIYIIDILDILLTREKTWMSFKTPDPCSHVVSLTISTFSLGRKRNPEVWMPTFFYYYYYFTGGRFDLTTGLFARANAFFACGLSRKSSLELRQILCLVYLQFLCQFIVSTFG